MKRRCRQDEIAALYRQGDLTTEEIARRFGIKAKTVSSIASRLGITRRRGGERAEIGKYPMWMVISDPLELFDGGKFMLDEIKTGARLRTWGDGILFQNVEDGRMARVCAGKVEFEG